MIQEKTFHTGPVTINYAEGPSNGPPLILLHGASAQWSTFLLLIPFLSMRWHVYALDFREHEKSSRTSGDYSIQAMLKTSEPS